MTLPLLDAVKAARPDVRLTVMAAETVAPLLRRQAAVDDVIPRPGGGARGFWRGVGRVRAGGFDAAVVVHPDLRDTLMVWGAGVPVRVGNGYRGYSFLYNRRVYFHRSPSEHHEVEYNLRYLEGLGLRPPAKAPAPRVAVTDEDRARARDVLKRHGVDRDGYAVIHPGSSGSALNWSPARYRTLALELGKALGVSIVVTGSAVEADLAAAVAGEGGARVSIAGETDLAALLGVLAGAGLFISSSTGPATRPTTSAHTSSPSSRRAASAGSIPPWAFPWR